MNQDYPRPNQLFQPPPYTTSELELNKRPQRKRKLFKINKNSCFANTWENFPVTISVIVFLVCLALVCVNHLHHFCLRRSGSARLAWPAWLVNLTYQSSAIVWTYYHPSCRLAENADLTSCVCGVTTKLSNTTEINNRTETAMIAIEKQRNKKEIEELKASSDLIISGLIEEHRVRETEQANDFIKERSDLIKAQQRRESQLIAYYVEQREAIKDTHLQQVSELSAIIADLEGDREKQDTITVVDSENDDDIQDTQTSYDDDVE